MKRKNKEDAHLIVDLAKGLSGNGVSFSVKESEDERSFIRFFKRNGVRVKRTLSGY
jgi:predicted SpoU family rRNA methylase